MILTAYTSLLFSIPAAIIRFRPAAVAFGLLAPVSFAVHAIGGRRWKVTETAAGRALDKLDICLAYSATVATTCGVAMAPVCFFTAPYYACLGTIGVMFFGFYPKPPACWVAHHAAFHAVSVAGTLFAYMCGV